MKDLLKFARKAFAQATLPDRWERARQMPDSGSRREALRKLLTELEPCLGEEGELALEIATELLAGNPAYEDLAVAGRISDLWPGDRRALDQALARAAGGCADERALPILARLGAAHPKDSRIQMLLGRALLKQGRCEAGALEALARAAAFLPEQDFGVLEQLLAPDLNVGVDSAEVEIQQAEAVATQFRLLAGKLRGVARVLGIAALRSGDPPAETLAVAADHFGQELALNPNDTEAQEGQIRVRLKSGWPGLLKGLGTGDSGALAGLQRVLTWLEGEGDEMEAPLSAAELEQATLPADAAWHRNFAVARLRLIEGDNAGAAALLKQAAAEDPDLGRVAYYAAWADLLTTGKRAVLEDWLEEYQEWKGAWTLLARVWDADPSAASGVQEYVLAEADPDFASLLRARRALALDEEVPSAPPRTGRHLEEDMEALRIRLGQACLRGDAAGVSARLEQPLFRLLPMADRLFWTAMQYCLGGVTEAARAEFERAAARGHRRAAWAISVLCAQRGELAEAAVWSQKALEDRQDRRGELWRRWLAAAGGDRAAQSEIAAAGGGAGKRAAKVGAYFAVAQADAAQRQGESMEATRRMEQALAVFKGGRGGERASPDAILMGACLQFWLNPQRGAPALSSHWNQVAAMPPSPRRAWLMWLIILAKLARNDPRQAPETAAALRQLLREAGPLSDPVRSALVRALAGVSQDAASAQSGEHWLAVLRQFPGDALEGEQRLAVAAAAWRRCASATGADGSLAQALDRESSADRANSLLALIAAFAYLQLGDGRTAAAILQQAGKAGGPPWLAAVAEVLPGQEPGEALAGLAALELDLSSATGVLLRALGAFRGGERETGFELILKAWRLRPEKVPGIFRVSQWVAVVCAGSSGQAPPQLLATVKDLGASSRDPQELDRLAHCAAVLSNEALARDLWTRAAEHSTDGRAFDRADFARYLCHRAAIKAKATRLDEAAALVREAAGHLPMSGAGGLG